MDKTDVSKIFQELVLNKHMIPNGQRDYVFSFRTVFHISKYLSYRWCPCAYEHENFDYISETGEINREMFEKIAESIRTGACPHVNMVSEDYVTSTKVQGIHVVAAVGSEERILRYLKNMSHEHWRYPRIPNIDCDPVMTPKFAHTPYSIALLKNKTVVTNTEFDAFKNFLCQSMIPNAYELCSVIHGTRTSENPDKVMLKNGSMIELSLRQQSMTMLKCILSTLLPIAKPSNIAKVYEAVYRKNKDHKLLSEIYTLMMAKLQKVSKHELYLEDDEELFVAETLIVCNQPDKLTNLIMMLAPKFKCRCRPFNFPNQCSLYKCKQTCKILHRPECECIFNFYCIKEDVESMSAINRRRRFAINCRRRSTCDFKNNEVKESLMRLLRDHPFSKNDIQEALEMIPNVGQNINHSTANRFTSKSLYKMNIEAVRMLVENESDINFKTYLFKKEKTGWQNTTFEYRQILELFIYSNPSIVKAEMVVAQGSKIDAMLSQPDTPAHLYCMPSISERVSCGLSEPWKYVCHKVLQGEYIMDASEHSFLYHNLSDICLNFTAPLLIESGFPIQQGEIEMVLQKGLHPAVKAYLQQCLDVPKSLKSLCRASLRKHFKGREIHKYVGKVKIPEPVRDFILLKTILPTISHDEWITVKLHEREIKYCEPH